MWLEKWHLIIMGIIGGGGFEEMKKMVEEMEVAWYPERSVVRISELLF